MFLSPIRCVAAAALGSAVILLAGCQPAKPSGMTLEQMRSSQESLQKQSQDEYSKGLAALGEKNPDLAMACFEAAIRLNPYNGPAHNELGTILYTRRIYHDAAVEFDAAAKNLPNTYEPLYNLGMVWEGAGRLKEAADAYGGARKIAPDELVVAENLARVYVKMGINTQETIRLLEESMPRELRPDWQRWMHEQLLRLRGGAQSQPASAPSPDEFPRP
jgi:Flp pilus assembly protein TadD